MWTKIVALVAILAMAGVAQAAKGNKANKPAKKTDKGLVGTVVSVNAASDGSGPATLVINAGHKKDAKEVTLTAEKGVTVTVNGAAGSLSDLKPGVKVRISPASGNVQTIDVISKGGGKQKNKAKKPK